MDGIILNEKPKVHQIFFMTPIVFLYTKNLRRKNRTKKIERKKNQRKKIERKKSNEKNRTEKKSAEKN
jgi:hypothetical protein